MYTHINICACICNMLSRRIEVQQSAIAFNICESVLRGVRAQVYTHTYVYSDMYIYVYIWMHMCVCIYVTCCRDAAKCSRAPSRSTCTPSLCAPRLGSSCVNDELTVCVCECVCACMCACLCVCVCVCVKFEVSKERKREVETEKGRYAPLDSAAAVSFQIHLFQSTYIHIQKP